MRLNFQTYFTLNTSYGIVGYNLLREFHKKNADVILFPQGGVDQQIFVEDYKVLLEKYHSNIKSPHLHKDGVSLNLNHQFLCGNHIGRGKKVAFTIFELDRLNPIEISQCSVNDLVITSTTYHRDILRKNGIASEFVPLGVDRSIFHENVKPAQHKLFDNKPTVFLHIGKCERRKGIDVIHEAFNKAFDDSDNVLLLMCTHNPFLVKRNWMGEVVSDGNKEWETYYRESKLGDRIYFLERAKTQAEMAQIIAASDCLLAPSRAEGFCMPALEALSMGKWVISSSRTAFEDYPDDAFILTTDIISSDFNTCEIVDLKIDQEAIASEFAFDEPFFKGQGCWFQFGEYQIEQMIDKMRTIHKLKQSGSLKNNTNGIKLSKQWTWDNTANLVLDKINNI